MPARLNNLHRHQQALRACRRCPAMHGPPVTGHAVLSPVMLIGQAPGSKEIQLHRPFAWTAGKTLFGWFARIGLEETAFRQLVYMSAVCRCFPGKNPKGGDRVPDKQEIANCHSWLAAEVALLKPELIIPVGKLAISQLMPVNKLHEVIGQSFKLRLEEHEASVIPLPHPSGASTWHRTEPGSSLLDKALRRIKRHPAWQTCCQHS